ncbi:MAG: hypothetical protein WD770_04295 [Actinomycetota bacterium]
MLVLATLGGAVWFTLAREGGAEPGPVSPTTVGGDHPVEFELRTGRVSVRSVAAEVSREGIDAATEGVHATVQALYMGAFVDPARWDGGAFPDAFQGFEKGAAERARRDLDALTLGSVAGELEWVEPSTGRYSIVFLLDGQNRPVTAVAGVVFRGIGHLKDGETVSISNGADLFLRPVDGAWRVFSYTASTQIAPSSTAGQEETPQ